MEGRGEYFFCFCFCFVFFEGRVFQWGRIVQAGFRDRSKKRMLGSGWPGSKVFVQQL